jgi:heat shock protein HslJ
VHLGEALVTALPRLLLLCLRPSQFGQNAERFFVLRTFGGAMSRIVRMLMTGLAACGVGASAAFAGALTASDLQGSWKLVEIASQPVQPAAVNALPVFTIKDQSIEGFDGCNSFWGRLDQPGSIASTRRGCLEGSLKLPLDLTDPMSHLKAGRIDKGRLILPEREEIPESIFERVD